jgi:creatinine amidohydrolase/Fe(II)-dependent formamide hydrolase-like protein
MNGRTRVRIGLKHVHLLAALLTAAIANAAEPPAGYRALFNGRDLTGWHGWNPHDSANLAGEKLSANLAKQREDFAAHWTVADGELVNVGTGPYATTDEDFGNIDLLIEYKTVARADSGIYLRGTPQVQIWDINQLSRPDNPDRNPNRGSGGLFNNTAKSPGRDPLVVADKPFGEWNAFHIRQIGNRTWVWLNEKLVVDDAVMENYWDRSRPLPEKGPIMLQTHGGEIRWRNIFVHNIESTEAAQVLADANAKRKASLPDPVKPDPESPRLIAARDTLFIEDLTWMEVRDAIRGGKDTVIVATGGVEQNGPWLVTGKHNIVLKATTEAIARKLGNALIAPIVPFVPEGDIDPPSLHMKYPGTISVTEETFQRLLTDICASLKTHGFKRIVMIGDSGGNQPGMKIVAAKLNEKWAGGSTTVHFIPEYYDYGSVEKWLKEQGVTQEPDGLHDDFAMTAMMLAVDPHSVRAEQRMKVNRFRINGVELAPIEKTIEWGKKIVDYRAEQTVKAYRASLAR